MVEMIDVQVYVAQFADGEKGLVYIREKEAEEQEGMAAREASLREITIWFYPIGKGKVRQHEHGDVELESVAALIEAWQKQGSPKVLGMARNEADLIQ